MLLGTSLCVQDFVWCTHFQVSLVGHGNLKKTFFSELSFSKWLYHFIFLPAVYEGPVPSPLSTVPGTLSQGLSVCVTQAGLKFRILLPQPLDLFIYFETGSWVAQAGLKLS